MSDEQNEKLLVENNDEPPRKRARVRTLSAAKIDLNDSAPRRMSLETKEFIKEIFEKGIVAQKSIKSKIEEAKFPILPKSQLYQIVNQLRSDKGLNFNSLSDLHQWCLNHSEIPSDDDDRPFVAAFQICIDDDEVTLQDDLVGMVPIDLNSYRLFITTKRLIQLTAHCKYIQIDSKIKFMYEKASVFFVGTTFEDKFQPLGVSFCSNDDYLDFQFTFKSMQSLSRSSK